MCQFMLLFVAAWFTNYQTYAISPDLYYDLTGHCPSNYVYAIQPGTKTYWYRYHAFEHDDIFPGYGDPCCSHCDRCHDLEHNDCPLDPVRLGSACNNKLLYMFLQLQFYFTVLSCAVLCSSVLYSAL